MRVQLSANEAEGSGASGGEQAPSGKTVEISQSEYARFMAIAAERDEQIATTRREAEAAEMAEMRALAEKEGAVKALVEYQSRADARLADEKRKYAELSRSTKVL